MVGHMVKVIRQLSKNSRAEIMKDLNTKTDEIQAQIKELHGGGGGGFSDSRYLNE